jgi:hypothetical protein
MELKDLTAQEWLTLVEGTGGAMGAVVTAQPSGPSGFDKEMTAAHDAMQELAGREWKSAFMTAFAGEILTGTREQDPEYQQLSAAQDQNRERIRSSDVAVGRSLDSIRSAVALVADKFGAEAAAEYKQYLYTISERVAGAAKEGGFLGLGGVMISENEKAALEQIKQTLGI